MDKTKTKKKLGRKRIEVDDEDLKTIERLARKGDTIDDIGAALGMCEATFHKIKNEDSRVSKAYKAGRRKMARKVRKRLRDIIFCENDAVALKAVIYWLDHQDGWAEKREENIESTNINISFAKE